ncbi:MAG: menaquinone biosynthesis protein [Planctomycetes bacterium]|nr:menaquinone biosynthesis protein [Planctomycetota bacterium]
MKAAVRLGVVSYLNAKPLIAGLEADPGVELLFDVPSRLPALLDDGTVDAALVPVIDLVRHERTWKVISDACIGCDGETFTVRVFSRAAPEAVRTLHVDGDSHTSVALARVIWLEMFGRPLEVLPYTGHEDADVCEAVLLIGDKVVTHKLIDFDRQTDLGAAWKSLTSLPFVFAVWAAPRNAEVSALARRLSAARDAGVAAARLIAADFGPSMGWPVALAVRYLTSRLKFTLGERQRQGMIRFLELARKHDLVPASSELEFA